MLREHYKIYNTEEVTEKEIEERPEVRSNEGCDSDDDYEVGRRAFNDGEGPPSPHQSNREVKRGYDDAEKASTSGGQLNKRARCE